MYKYLQGTPDTVRKKIFELIQHSVKYDDVKESLTFIESGSQKDRRLNSAVLNLGITITTTRKYYVAIRLHILSTYL
jgi:hypothetical protein